MSTCQHRKRTKSFRVEDPNLLGRFELLCKTFHLKEHEAFDAMLRKWIKENEETLRLDNFLKNGATINIIQPQQVNIAVKAELTYVKLELSRVLDGLETGDEEYRNKCLRDLTRIILKASRIEGATQDQELGELLAKAECHLK